MTKPRGRLRFAMLHPKREPIGCKKLLTHEPWIRKAGGNQLALETWKHWAPNLQHPIMVNNRVPSKHSLFLKGTKSPFRGHPHLNTRGWQVPAVLQLILTDLLAYLRGVLGTVNSYFFPLCVYCTTKKQESRTKARKLGLRKHPNTSRWRNCTTPGAGVSPPSTPPPSAKVAGLQNIRAGSKKH